MADHPETVGKISQHRVPHEDLRDLLLHEAREVNRTATVGIGADEVEVLKRILEKIRQNLAANAETRRATAPRRNGEEAH